MSLEIEVVVVTGIVEVGEIRSALLTVVDSPRNGHVIGLLTNGDKIQPVEGAKLVSMASSKWVLIDGVDAFSHESVRGYVNDTFVRWLT